MPHVRTPALRWTQPRLLIALLGLFGLYVVGLDQGLLFSLAQGDLAYAQNVIHEALHDARHAAAFPCH